MEKPQVKKQIKYIGTNIKLYFSLYFAVLGFMGVVITIVGSFLNLSELFGDMPVWARILIVLGVFVLLAILILPFFFLKKRAIYYKNGEHEVTAEYGDIERISSKKGDKKMVVISVNTGFDMIVENPGENALVSENTNHGRFIKRVCKEENISYEQLNKKVQELLAQKDGTSSTIVNKRKGNPIDYKVGTYVIYELGKIYYLLFALSRFDEKNNAHPGKESKDHLPLEELLNAINDSSQNLDVYVPLMGTSNSRYQLSFNESFNEMKHFFLSHRKQVESKIHIVVNSRVRDEVSIFKNN